MLDYLYRFDLIYEGLTFLKENFSINESENELIDLIMSFINKRDLFFASINSDNIDEIRALIPFGKELNSLRDEIGEKCDLYMKTHCKEEVKAYDVASKASFVLTSILYNRANMNMTGECHQYIMRDVVFGGRGYESRYRFPFAVAYSIYKTKQDLYLDYSVDILKYLEVAKEMSIEYYGKREGIMGYAIMCTEPEYKKELKSYLGIDKPADKISGLIHKTYRLKGNK